MTMAPETGDNGDSVQPLTGRWMLALDPDNRGRQEQWYARMPAVDAREAPVPGTIQQVFPAQHGVAW